MFPCEQCKIKNSLHDQTPHIKQHIEAKIYKHYEPRFSMFFRNQSLECNPVPSFQIIFPYPKIFTTGMNRPENTLQM
jgi:hypothetical protein